MLDMPSLAPREVQQLIRSCWTLDYKAIGLEGRGNCEMQSPSKGGWRLCDDIVMQYDVS